MKKLILSLVVAMALIGAVYGAAATITIGGIDTLGSNSEPVAASYNVTQVTYVLDDEDIMSVTGVIVQLDAATVAGDQVCVQVTDGGVVEANGCVTPGAVAANTDIVIAFDSTPSSTADAELIDDVEVTIIQAI